MENLKINHIGTICMTLGVLLYMLIDSGMGDSVVDSLGLSSKTDKSLKAVAKKEDKLQKAMSSHLSNVIDFEKQLEKKSKTIREISKNLEIFEKSVEHEKAELIDMKNQMDLSKINLEQARAEENSRIVAPSQETDGQTWTNQNLPESQQLKMLARKMKTFANLNADLDFMEVENTRYLRLKNQLSYGENKVYLKFSGLKASRVFALEASRAGYDELNVAFNEGSERSIDRATSLVNYIKSLKRTNLKVLKRPVNPEQVPEDDIQIWMKKGSI